MRTVACEVSDFDVFDQYFDDDGPPRSAMFFVETHTKQVQDKFLPPIVGGDTIVIEVGGEMVEYDVIRRVVDLRGEEPVAYLLVGRMGDETGGYLS